MNNPYFNLSNLIDIVEKKKHFRNAEIIYQGYRSLELNMFRRYLPISAAILYWWGEELKSEKYKNINIVCYDKITGCRHNDDNVFLAESPVFFDEILKTCAADKKYFIVPFMPSYALQKYVFEKKARIQLLNNNWLTHRYFEDKINFFENARKYGIPIPDESELNYLNNLKFDKLIKKYPTGFVTQVAYGNGGSGNFFIFNKNDFECVIDKLHSEYKKNIRIKITKFFNGPSFNCTACITKGNIILSQPNYQIVGEPNIVSNQGQFLGSDFTAKISDDHKKIVLDAMLKAGNWLGSCGYRGIYGLDFLSEINANGEVENICVIEINARIVGEMEIMPDMAAVNNCVALDFFQLAEFMDIPINEKHILEYNNNLPQMRGSIIQLHTNQKGILKLNKNFDYGVYRIINGSLKKIRKGIDITDLNDTDEFIIGNGIPTKDFVVGSPEYPNDINISLGHLLTLDTIMQPPHFRQLNKKWLDIIKIIQKQFENNMVNVVNPCFDL